MIDRPAPNSRVRPSVGEFLRDETAGGVLMLSATVIALLWANFGSASYHKVSHLQLGPLTLEHWATDGLLTIFFFVAGLELKRELTVGSLSRPANALVPIVAALAGMVVPALCYVAVNLALGAALDRPTAPARLQGWAVPMATDIAFALAVLAVAGRGLPAALRVFLLTLAIVDDLGSILVIAVVFTQHVQLIWLAGAAGCVALWWLLQRRGIDAWWIFVPLGVLAWVCTLNSGVHATIAGVAIGLVTRSRASSPTTPATAERWEHFWRPISAAVAVPLFALLSTGVRINGQALSALVSTPLALGVLVGLVIGKPIGIFGGAYLTARLTRARLAPGLRWSEVFSASLLAGVGFTVALLVSDLAFGLGSADAESSKSAVLFGSLIAAGVATISLHRRRRSRTRGVVRPGSAGDPIAWSRTCRTGDRPTR